MMNRKRLQKKANGEESIMVMNDGVIVFEGTVQDFISDNQEDQLVVELCKELENKDVVEHDDVHSGNWVIKKLIGM